MLLRVACATRTRYLKCIRHSRGTVFHLETTYGGICTKASAPRELDGPQYCSIKEVSFSIQSATDTSTQSSISCVVVAFPRDFPPRESKNQRMRIGLSFDGDVYTYITGTRKQNLDQRRKGDGIEWCALEPSSSPARLHHRRPGVPGECRSWERRAFRAGFP